MRVTSVIQWIINVDDSSMRVGSTQSSYNVTTHVNRQGDTIKWEKKRERQQ